MSDSGLSSVNVNISMDVEYEQSLQRAVRNGFKANEDVTINSARERAEKELGLPAGFFKNDAEWKAKSKAIVQAAVEDPQSSPEKSKPNSKPKSKPVVSRAKAGTKRKSDNVAPASNKRSKKAAKTIRDSDASELSHSEVEDSKKEVKGEDDRDVSEFGDSDEDEKPKTTAKKARSQKASQPKVKAPVKRKPAAKKLKDESESGTDEEAPAKPAKRKSSTSKKSQDVVESDMEVGDVPASRTNDESELSDAPDSIEDVPPKANGIPAPEDDESDMSVLIDDPPPKKKRASNGTSKPKTTKASKSAASKKKAPELSPNEQEIKRLQGWIVKCGVRKLWHIELKDCGTEKAKIQHLKKMLEGLGMTGRYSNEKAKGIVEARELAAELEETQEYAAKYGTDGKVKASGDSDEERSEDEEDTKPAGAAVPRKPKGFVDFGDSGDEID